MVCNYWALNSNTIHDCTLLPYIDEIMNDAIWGRIYTKINMTNTFFQTCMNLEHILLTAISTLFGLYKWTVMPMGLCNAPATQQQRVTKALGHLIGKICHVYLDDIIIWLESEAEHIANIGKVMQVLCNEGLICL